MKVLKSDIDGESTILLWEKVKLYQIIEKNEAIVDFLSQETLTSINEDGETVQIDVGEEEDDNILIPDEHPKQFTSLDELQEKLDNLKKILENKKLKEDDQKKLSNYIIYIYKKKYINRKRNKISKS